MKKYNEAINICLQVIGEQILEDTTEITDIYEAEQADLVLEATKKEVLAEGWSFNTDDNYELTPDEDGYITLPEDALRVDPSDIGSNYVRREGKLYDKANRTFVFEDGVECDIVWELDFDDLPPIFQQYITLKAARILYQRLVGATDMLNILMKDEQDAWIRTKAHEDDVSDLNIFDDTTVSRLVTRTANPSGIRG